MKISTQPYRGTRDFYPADMRLRNWFFGKIRHTLDMCAFDEYNGPTLEPLDLYIAKSGTEIASEQTYNFEDKSGHRLAVRPEMTPTAARLVAAKINELNFPLRWFSVPNLYRYERPMRGRLREHWQVNADIFGADGFEADLEVVALAVRILLDFGADESMFSVRINNRRFFNEVIAAICEREGADAVKISKVVDRRGKTTREEYVKAMKSLDLTDEQIEKIDKMYEISLAEALEISPDGAGAKELRDLFAGVAALGLDRCCSFDFSVIRGLDYYTGTVFEVFDLDPENNRAMFGGGRYDDLVGLFGVGKGVSGVGFGFGDVTLENFLRSHSLIPEAPGRHRKVLILRFGGVEFSEYAKISDCLRSAGISAAVYLNVKKIGKQIDFADKEGFTHIIAMGEDELARGTLKVKELASRGEAELPRERLLEYFH